MRETLEKLFRTGHVNVKPQCFELRNASMDSPVVSLNPSTRNGRIPRWGWGILALGLLLYCILLGTHVGAYAGGADSSGYMNNTRLLAERRMHIERRSLASLPPEKTPSWTYVPLGFIPVKE